MSEERKPHKPIPGLWPRSLPGQITLLAAIALFVAQAINFTLLLRERQQGRLGQVIFPAATRITDAVDRLNAGIPIERRAAMGNGISLSDHNMIDPSLRRQTDVEEGIRRILREWNIPVRTVVTGLHPMSPDDPALAQYGPVMAERIRRIRRYGVELKIAVDLPGRGWIHLSAAWPHTEQFLVWQLLGQTAVLYIFVLLPLLWSGYRIALPLRNLAKATRRFQPGTPAPPVDERGPSDVRAVIAAYNALSLRVNAMIDEKDQMLAAIGHDLRTPLAALRVRIESVEDDTDRARMADVIDEMNRTLEDILSLARLGRPSEPVTDTDLSALVDAVVEDFRDLDHDVTFEETDRLRMRLRPALMRRAIRNLIENAVKYAGAAEVRIIPAPRNIAIEVADRGPGIPAEALLKVFDPFTRLETSRNRDTGGIGLGLALSRAIVAEAGGEIILQNRPGGGLLARIVLPKAA
jgi:signal transduction histidine kinase